MRDARPTRRLGLALLCVLVGLTLASCGGGEPLSGLLVLARPEGIVEYDLSSGDERLLVPKPEDSALIEPAASPDSTRFAYVRQLTPIVVPEEDIELGMDLYLANSDGSEAGVLLEHEQQYDQVRAPAWLPDGERLLFNLQRLEGNRLSFWLELLDVESGARTVIIEDALRPDVSPDGTRIVFVRQDESFVQTLWLANIDGSDQRLLAGPEDALGSFNSPRFSPDGSTIAFGGAPPFEQLIAGDGGELVSRNALRAAAPAYNGLPEDIWVIGADGSGLRMLAELQADLPSLTWSDDGEHIYVLSGIGFFDIDPVEGSARRLGDGTFHGQLDWLPTGATALP